MASVMDDSYRKVLLLGAIAAASAFVVTIVIVVVCVGCQSSISKSDTRLHEINRLPRNGNSE
uniref:Uncharacterized protein n=1 Tax=Oncorhynchus kisutch TaxID=8019 RepID=A0A8C7NB95_ONCKI